MLLIGLKRNGFRATELEPFPAEARHSRRFIIEQRCPVASQWWECLLPGQWYQGVYDKDGKPATDEACVIRPRLLQAIDNPPKAVVVCREPHATIYYSGESTEAIGLAALDVLARREKEGLYEVLKEPAAPLQTPEDFPNSPDFAEFARKAREAFDRDLEEYTDSVDFAKSAALALETKNYKLAADLLEQHSRRRYEGWEIEPLSPVGVEGGS